LVAGTNVDALDLHAALAHRGRKLVHHWTGGALQKQERSFVGPMNLWPLTFGRAIVRWQCRT
jgi:hypothetical protein